MKKSIISTLLLTVPMLAGAQNYGYRYWLDNDVSTQAYGTVLPGTESSFTADISRLEAGIHAIHVQSWSGDSRMDLSSVYTRFFAVTRQLQAVTAQYWFDNDAATTHSITASGTFDLDVSQLANGIHAVHYQTYASDGTASAVYTRFFYVDLQGKEMLSCQMWIDDDEPTIYELNGEDVIIDISGRTIGTHTLHARLSGSDGLVVGERAVTFEVSDSQAGITPAVSMTTNSQLRKILGNCHIYILAPNGRKYTIDGIEVKP